MRLAWIIPVLLLATAACGSTTETRRHRPLSDDAIAAFGAERSDAPAPSEAEAREAATAIELAGGERLEELRALIRFDAGEGSDPSCALYALRVRGNGLAEGRVTVACDAAQSTTAVSLAPVEDDRSPRLVAALTGARLDPGGHDEASVHSPRAVHLWLTTNRREVDGDAAPIRWPSPNAEATEAPADRSPENLSEVWEAVMYPHRYR